jgi:DNA polymerase-1
MGKQGTDRPLVLLDADLLIYRALSNTEKEICWDEEYEIWILSTDLKAAKRDYIDSIDRYLEKYNPSMLVVAITDRQHNFRKDILPSYKGHRDGKRKPMGFRPFLEWSQAQDTYDAYNYGGIVVKPITYSSLEADDVCGILATKPGNEHHIIVSDDKDMLTIPCNVVRMGEYVTVTEADADRYHLMQTLTGDPVDNYSGCPGIGPVKAEKILQQGWNGIVNAYQKAGLTADDALVQARVARILRWSDWDHEKKEPKLWTPSIVSSATN